MTIMMLMVIMVVMTVTMFVVMMVVSMAGLDQESKGLIPEFPFRNLELAHGRFEPCFVSILRHQKHPHTSVDSGKRRFRHRLFLLPCVPEKRVSLHKKVSQL